MADQQALKEPKDAKTDKGAQPKEDKSERTTAGVEGVKTREQEVWYGIVGDKPLEKRKRNVPHDEPPALAENKNLTVIGKPLSRADGVQKATGKARYTFDVQLPHMLYGRRVSSPWPHAHIVSIDTSEAEKYPGVRAVHVLTRTLNMASLKDGAAEKKANKYPLIRYTGQPIAAVAAVTQKAADEAARLIKIEVTELPAVTELEDAMRDGAPLVFPGPTEQPPTAGGGGAPAGLPQKGNIRGPNTKGPFGGARGDVAKGIAEADVVVEAKYVTQVQTHVPMETHGVVVDWRDDAVTVYASTQFTTSVRDEVAEFFEIPRSRVRVIADYVGGGFGAKYGIGNYGLLACHLSRKAKAPVRMMLDRKEEHLSEGNRPGTIQTLTVAAKKTGELTAIKLVSHGTGGVATGAGVGFCQAGMYACPNYAGEQYDVFTNAGPAAAFRAPGQPQGLFGLEQSIDEIAHKLNMDPLKLREVIDTNDTDDARARKAERRIGAEKFGWSKRRAPASDKGPVKRGMGMAQSHWLYLVRVGTACEVRVTKDGSIEAFSAAQDIGTGTRTVLGQVVAEELGVPFEQVQTYIGDTRYPYGPPSGGSMVTSSLTPAARNAAHRCARDLAALAAGKLESSAEDVSFVKGKLVAKNGKSMTLAEAAKLITGSEISHRVTRPDDYGGYMHKGDVAVGKSGIGGVQFVELTVDTETGIVKVDRVLAVADCGRPINPKLVESQVNGGVIQGLSYALYEERHLDQRSGLQLNAGVDTYKIAGSREMPVIEVALIEQLTGNSSTDARGVAEASNAPTAAAIANAFFNATGKRIRTLPLTPANVLAALKA